MGWFCWFSSAHGFLSLSPSTSLPGTRTHQAPRGWSPSQSPATISLDKTRGLPSWKKSSAGSPHGLFLHLGSAPTTCTDTEDAAHQQRLTPTRAEGCRGPARQTSRNNTEDQPCRLFTLTQTHTLTHAHAPSQPAWETPITVSVGLVANRAGRGTLRCSGR